MRSASPSVNCDKHAPCMQGATEACARGKRRPYSAPVCRRHALGSVVNGFVSSGADVRGRRDN